MPHKRTELTLQCNKKQRDMQNYFSQTQMAALMPIFEPFLNAIAEKVAAKLEPIIREPKKVEQKLYSREEVCELLHISKPTLKKLSDNGLLNPIKMGDRRILFDAEQIQQVLDNNINIKYLRK